VEAGLARIKALDAKLSDKETEAMIMIRCVQQSEAVIVMHYALTP